MSIIGKHFLHTETGVVVQVSDTPIVSTGLDRCPIKTVVAVFECGLEYQYEIEAFMLEFELVEEMTLRVLEIEHDAEDHEFWDALSEFFEQMGHGPLPTMEELKEEAAMADNVSRIH